MDSSTLPDRIEALTGPCDEIDLEIVKLAYEKRWPMDPIYPGAINYDPELWQGRYGFSPTASIDAAITLVEREQITDVFNAAWRIMSNKYALYCHSWPEDKSFTSEFARHICAAALRARGVE
jgi:hypothetical protein